MNRILASVLMAALLAACSSQQTKDGQSPAPVVDASGNVAPPVSASPPPGKTTPSVQAPIKGVAVEPPKPETLGPKSGILAQRSVFFDYDSYAVKDEFKPLVTAHSKYLTGNRTQKITVEGNTDTRGSREYNIALGQRRADAVKRMMTLLGVTDEQIETVSLGKEKPRSTADDEAAHSQNRRSDIRYQGE